MNKFVMSTIAAATLLTGGFALAAQAAAVPLGGAPVEDAVRTLQAEGYIVRINQTVTVPLSRCVVTNVSGLRGATDDPGQLNVAFLDVDCTH